MAIRWKKTKTLTAKTPNREIKMVRFLGFDWVITNSYKKGSTRYYDIIGATHEPVAGQRMVAVPLPTIKLYRDANDFTFERMRNNHGAY